MYVTLERPRGASDGVVPVQISWSGQKDEVDEVSTMTSTMDTGVTRSASTKAVVKVRRNAPERRSGDQKKGRNVTGPQKQFSWPERTFHGPHHRLYSVLV